MKKTVLSPLCSALVIPGLGQILNQQLKKGILILALVFVFIMVFTFELYQLTLAVLKPGLTNAQASATLMDRIMAQDHASLVMLFAGFAVLWIYSIVDALIGGIKVDHIDEGHTQKEL